MKTIINQQISPKDIIDRFMLSLRNYELYPAHHVVTQASVTDCMEQLLTYVQTEGSLSLRITRDSMFHDDEVVYQGVQGEENPAYQMYRDGIEVLEFHHGITRGEFQKFLQILKHHSQSRRQEENDIVTELWSADLSAITYKTTDVFWKDEPVLDFSSIRVVDTAAAREEKQSEEQAGAVSISETIGESGMFELTPEEMRQTVMMVHDEENRNFDEDIFDVLLIILKEQRKEDDFAVVLDIIMESFQNSLERAEFESVVNFFTKLKELEVFYKEKQPWATPYLDDFMLVISSNKVLSSLQKAWQHINVQNEYQLENMRKILTALSPVAVHSLCQLIPQVSSAQIQRQLIESVKELSKKDGRPLRMLLSHPDEKIVQNAVYILGQIPGEEVTKVLKEKLNASTGKTKVEVVKSLAKRKPLLAKTLIKLADDPEPEIRTTVFSRLGKERNQLAEEFFIDMITTRKFTKKNLGLLMKLYRALGGCGSVMTIPFLERQLSRRFFFRRQVASAHRTGAVLALELLKLPEAEIVMGKNTKKIQQIRQNSNQLD